MWTWLLLVALCAAANPACPVYTCNSTLPSGICMLETDNSMQVNACGPGQVCPFVTSGNSTCDYAPPVELYPGDYCANNAFCTTGLCVNGVCSNVASSYNCTNVYDCSPGLFCNISSLLCEPQLNSGESCFMDFDCQNDKACVWGQCVAYLSLPIGAPVDAAEDIATGLTFACSSGFSTVTAGQRVCALAPHSTAVPQKCQPGSMCSDSSGTYSAACICGFNGEGFCPLFPGDQLVMELLSSLDSVLTFNAYCNTFSRFRFTCFAESEVWQKNEFNQFQERYALITEGLYPLYWSAEDENCLQEALLPDLVAYMEAANNTIASTCIPHTCQESGSDQCLLYDISVSGFQYSAPSVYLSACLNETEVCFIENSMNGTCQGPVPTRYSGDYCETHMDCLSGDCASGICQGFLVNSNCSNIYDCNPGTYCDLDTLECTPQKTVNMVCNSDYDCENNLGCNIGVCTPYFSLPINATTDSEDEDGLALVCETGFAFLGACTEAPKSLHTPGANCTLDSECYSTIDEWSKPCTCTYSGTGKQYCPMFPGDPIPQQAIAVLKQLIPFNFICGSYSRFREGCFLRMNNALAPFYAYQSLMMNYTMWAEMQEAEECYAQTLGAEYYRAAENAAYYNKPKPTPDNDENPSGAHTLLAAFGALVALA